MYNIGMVHVAKLSTYMLKIYNTGMIMYEPATYETAYEKESQIVK